MEPNGKIVTALDNLTKAVNNLTTSHESLKTSQEAMRQQLEMMSNNTSQLSSSVQKISADLTRHKAHFDNKEREKNLIIFGFREKTEGERDLLKVIIALFRDLGVESPDVAFVDAFRLGKKGGLGGDKKGEGTRPVMVKFISKRWVKSSFAYLDPLREKGLSIANDLSPSELEAKKKLKKISVDLKLRGFDAAVKRGILFCKGRRIPLEDADKLIANNPPLPDPLSYRPPLPATGHIDCHSGNAIPTPPCPAQTSPSQTPISPKSQSQPQNSFSTTEPSLQLIPISNLPPTTKDKSLSSNPQELAKWKQWRGSSTGLKRQKETDDTPRKKGRTPGAESVDNQNGSLAIMSKFLSLTSASQDDLVMDIQDRAGPTENFTSAQDSSEPT